MNQTPYLYEGIGQERYIFTSTGKKTIVKIAEFTRATDGNIVNLGFGDLLPDGRLDDRAISNNGDIIKIFATLIVIIKEFAARFPHLKIAFTGSTPERTKMYNRILTMYYTEFSREFKITGIIEHPKMRGEVDFEPDILRKYLFYFVKKI